MTAEAHVYRTALRATIIAIGVLALIGVVVGLLVAGTPGLVAALVGVGVAALAGLTTQAAMLVGHGKGPATLMMMVLGSWAVKMLVIIVALVVLQGIEDFSREWFAVFALTGIIATLVIDMWVLRKSQVPYTQSRSETDAQ